MNREEKTQLIARLANTNILTEDFSYIVTELTEKRTCKNCIYFKIGMWDKDIPSNRYCTVNRHCSGFDYKGYECNKWEAKND